MIYSYFGMKPHLGSVTLGIMILGLAFFKDSVPQRPRVERGRGFQLTKEDVLRISRAVLTVTNSMISTSQVIFSAVPLMTLKVRLQFGSVFSNIVRDIVSLNNLGACGCCNP